MSNKLREVNAEETKIHNYTFFLTQISFHPIKWQCGISLVLYSTPSWPCPSRDKNYMLIQPFKIYLLYIKYLAQNLLHVLEDNKERLLTSF